MYEICLDFRTHLRKELLMKILQNVFLEPMFHLCPLSTLLFFAYLQVAAWVDKVIFT